ncbi:hypothetical protein MES4922_100069 [Mesorhizobium ventifaucium]|uniref:Uncharacterized protein n=1 Tax=Mesorhizobium ventifaucium TaxID=666020 RepID=A0ABM9DEE0_9HYPH|nr:hypothetical protein MES4922_100069 [Mesorhizobium ventifaucium]
MSGNGATTTLSVVGWNGGFQEAAMLISTADIRRKAATRLASHEDRLWVKSTQPGG